MTQPVTFHFKRRPRGVLALVAIAAPLVTAPLVAAPLDTASLDTASLAAAADAASIAAGKAIAAKGSPHGVPPCSACHGANGEGQTASDIPRLAGLDGGYMQAQLTAFGNGTRDNAIMTSIVKTMDAKSMADAAAYYASLAAPVPPAPGKPNPDAAKGKAIALRGDWSAGIPPCASCHGKRGHGVGTAFPAIAGQSSAYIKNQLLAWKKGTRHDDPLGLMKTVAARLSDAQVAAVAAYYETLPAASTRTSAEGRRTTP